MTVEEITSLTVLDISSIEIQCDTCQASVTIQMTSEVDRESPFHPEKMLKRRWNCPCGSVIWSTDDEHVDDPARDFVRALFQARSREIGRVKLKIVASAASPDARAQGSPTP